jgi:hypothetical protein
MITRDDIHRLVDQLPNEKLAHVQLMLSAVLNPPPTPPQAAEMRKRGHEYRKKVEERFRQTRKPGTISGMGGGGRFSFDTEHGSFGSHSFHYWDDKALVYQTMRYFSGQEFEHMERLAISEDGTQLLYEQEVASGGRTVRHEEAFPLTARGSDIASN